ncbi:MAG: DUF896 domain-containing protein [Clostridia bacterium]|nr:DUF896 domain-containing protein [Clostridia bacterium]
MDKKKLERISELSRKQRSSGLNDTEKAEQAELRKEYLAAIRKSLIAELDNIEIVD